MKYSPAPWNIEEHAGYARTYRFVICAPNYDNRVAVISLNGEARGDNAIAQANARLIASAPDLLEALEILVEHAMEKYPHFESQRGQEEIKSARDVIAKVKG